MSALGALARQMLASPTPGSDEPAEALLELGIPRTGAAMLVFAQLRKAWQGDVNGAKFIKELALGAESAEEGSPDLKDLSDGELFAMLAALRKGE